MEIAILESLGISEQELAGRTAPFEAEGHRFRLYERTTEIAALQERLRTADVAILANMPLPAAAFETAANLKYINIAFTGVDHVAVSSAKERGIVLSNASGYSNQAVAEMTIAMVLSLYRRLPQAERRARAGKTKDGLIGCEIRGKTVGIIGYGKIGRCSAALFLAFGTSVLANNRRRLTDLPAGVRQVELDELLAESDIVVLHCPLTEQTEGMIDSCRLAQMKPSAILINVARGPVVVAADLAKALDEGVIAGAGIDVFDMEPPLPLDEPLLYPYHSIITPHVAFATQESMLLRADIVFANLAAWLSGAPQNLI
ncbi:MAG: NAD(P)-dependent oxidoreductase [Lachnospiraceae bacterium]|nr:NAD(P)-dependent oxidoreductase [Lachnospiraceae bacterium]MDY5741950.1 NAD(P)-dependent oxidoreductase [Lachnospiraceae bacterium]